MTLTWYGVLPELSSPLTIRLGDKLLRFAAGLRANGPSDGRPSDNRYGICILLMSGKVLRQIDDLSQPFHGTNGEPDPTGYG